MIKGLDLMIPTFAKAADYSFQITDGQNPRFLKLKTVDFDHPKSVI